MNRKPFRGIRLNKTHPLNRGLVGAWLMNEGSGIKAFDLSGNSNHGTLTNMNPDTAWIPTKFGGSLDFDGSNDYIDTNFQPTDVGTLSAWIKFDTTGSAESMGIRSSGNARFYIGKNTSDQPRMGVGNSTITYTGTTIGAGEWHHFALVARGAGTAGADATLYFDGVNVTTGNYTWTQGAITDLFIGAYSNPSATSFLDGTIDEVRIYDRALSADEVRQLFQRPPELYQADEQPMIFGTLDEAGSTIQGISTLQGISTITF